MAFLSREELQNMGFASIGEEVFISDKASIHNPSQIAIGSYVRIDDYCVLSPGEGGIEIGSYIHISCHACLIGHARITLNDFVAISVKASILSSTSDFSGEFLPSLKEFDKLNKASPGLTEVISEPVVLETNTGIGAHSVVMPGVTIGLGSVVGALSTVYQNLNPWGIYLGNPARFVKKRSDKAYQQILEAKKNATSG